MKHYPSSRYHPTKEAIVVMNEAQDEALGAEWVESPAEFGLETCPGASPDPEILANGEAYRKRIEALKASSDAPEPRKPGRPKKAEPKEGDK